MSTRILLVEDDPVSCDLFAALLVSQGHVVETAGDGFNALRLAQETPYDIVFIDYHLPEMDGYALARLIRAAADRNDRPLKMVAITADRFGLAARRGADTIFDHMLAKPIAPDALFDFVATLIGSMGSQVIEELDTFLGGPSVGDAQGAAQALWRVRGIGTLPKAAVFPAPSPAEKAALGYCFTLVEPDAADCIVLLSEAGRLAVENIRANGKVYLQPMLVIDEALAPLADIRFEVGDGDSWSSVAAVLTSFAARRADVDTHAASSRTIDTRVLAYLTVAARDLVLRRDQSGRTIVPYTGGFAQEPLIEAVRRLAAQGLVTTRRRVEGDRYGDELSVFVTEKGSNSVARGSLGGGSRRA